MLFEVVELDFYCRGRKLKNSAVVAKKAWQPVVSKKAWQPVVANFSGSIYNEDICFGQIHFTYIHY